MWFHDQFTIQVMTQRPNPLSICFMYKLLRRNQNQATMENCPHIQPRTTENKFTFSFWKSHALMNHIKPKYTAHLKGIDHCLNAFFSQKMVISSLRHNAGYKLLLHVRTPSSCCVPPHSTRRQGTLAPAPSESLPPPSHHLHRSPPSS